MTGELCEADIFPSKKKDKNEINDGRVEDLLLEERYTRCSKKHEHNRFFVVKDLTLDDIPQETRCLDALTWIQDRSNQTVKLVVKYTAKIRPDKFGAKALRGTTHFRCGTGWVELITSRLPVPGFSPGTTFHVQTAAHVVYNDEEAENTQVWFFFHDDDDRSGVVKAQGMYLTNVDVDADVSMMICKVADVKTGDKIWQKLDEGSSRDESPFPANFSLTYCISCPHGMALRVSFGKLKIAREKCVTKSQVGELKLVFSRMEKCGISEIPKILYFHCHERLKDHTPVLNLQVRDPVTSVLQHLVDRNLVKKPTDEEFTTMQQMAGTYTADLETMVVTLLAEEDLSDLDIVQAFHNDRPRIRALAKKAIIRETSGYNLPDGVKDLYKKINAEMSTKMVDIESQGNAVAPKEKRTQLSKLTYSVSTCPGSSGGQVWSMEIYRGRLTMYTAVHSMGGGRDGNLSQCGAVSV